MDYQAFQRKNLPGVPGVYFFLGPKGIPLYIGRATSLRDRVRSYFSRDIKEARGAHIAAMVIKAKNIRVISTDSLLEALILEAELIRKYAPPYNTKEKDDKSFNHIVITKEEFPRVLVVRGRELSGGLSVLGYRLHDVFGPFPRGGTLRDAMKIIRKLFPFRDTCAPYRSDAKAGVSSRGKPCFNRQLGLCPGVCTGEISAKEYRKQIRDLRFFLHGKKDQVLKSLKRQMRKYARRQEFEKAGEIKTRMFSLEHIRDVALIKRNAEVPADGCAMRIEGYDIAHLGGAQMVGVMTVVEEGEAARSEYRKFKIRSFKGVDDTRALREILERRLAHPEWRYPRLIVVDGGVAQKNAAERTLAEAGVAIPVVGVVKDERHRPREIVGILTLRRSLPVTCRRENMERLILLANAEAHRFAITYHRRLRNIVP